MTDPVAAALDQLEAAFDAKFDPDSWMESTPPKPGRLSKLQRTILTAIAVVIYNDNEWEDSCTGGMAPRRNVYEVIEASYFTFDPDRSFHRQQRAHRGSFDRALATLFKRGYVNGLTLAWVLVSQEGGRASEDIWDWQGGGRRRADSPGMGGREPALKRLGLTDAGWHAVDINGQPLGELLTHKGPGATRVTEITYQVEITDLVGLINCRTSPEDEPT